MQSKMTVRLVFDFKGKTHRLDTEINLPVYINDVDEFMFSLPRQIAKQHQIPIHSYEFEMLESAEIDVVNFTSRIESVMPKLPISLDNFIDLYQSKGQEAYLEKIAEAYGLDIGTNPRIAKALKAAYVLGKDSKLTDSQSQTSTWLQRGFS